MGSLPANCSPSRTVPIWDHAVLEHGGWNMQDQTSLTWTLPQGQQLSPDFLLYCGVLSMCWSSGQANLVPLYGPQPPSGQIHLFHHGLIHGLQHGMPCSAGICSMSMVYDLWSMVYHGLQGDSQLCHQPLHRPQRSSGTWSPSSFTFFAHLGVCKVFFSLISSFLPLSSCHTFFSLS